MANAVDEDLEVVDRNATVTAGADTEDGGGAADRQLGGKRPFEVEHEAMDLMSGHGARESTR
jgi:hypothetical protein